MGKRMEHEMESGLTDKFIGITLRSSLVMVLVRGEKKGS